MGAFGADPTSHLDLFDFSEFDEENDLADKTQKDKVAKIIASKFDGGLDDIGFQRIVSTGNSETDASNSRLRIDEYTSPGEIAHVARRIIEEIKKVPYISPEDSVMSSSFEMELASIESQIRVDRISECDIQKLIDLYKKIYRLNRRAAYKECVVVDCQKVGYMKYFAPYFM
jgi:hypothetical protein